MTKIMWVILIVSGGLLCIGMAQEVQQKVSPEIITLTEDNHVLFDDEVSGRTVSQAMSDFGALLAKRGDKNYPIYLVLDTPGGSVLAGYRLYEFLKPYKNIHTITLGSYSMGAILVELIDGDRLITETGTIMFHRMTTSLGEPGHTEVLQGSLDYSKLIEATAEKAVAERVGIPQDKLREKFNAELYLLGTEAVKQNFVDRVVVVKCSENLLKQKKKRTVQPVPFLPPMEIETPACPMQF